MKNIKQIKQNLRNRQIHNNQNGVALILALIMLLVMSVLALTVSFTSNTDFQAMSTYKQGQESFLAAESCVLEARSRFEIFGANQLYFIFQGNAGDNFDEILVAQEFNSGSFCRSGGRFWHSPVTEETEGGGEVVTGTVAPIIEIPPPSKTIGRPLQNSSLHSGGGGFTMAYTITFTVTGKDSRDKDKNDINENINTGTEIAVGLEVFEPGGESNIYSGL